MVGNDQPDEPWVDESLVQYITYLYYLDTYGPEAAEQFRDSFYFRIKIRLLKLSGKPFRIAMRNRL